MRGSTGLLALCAALLALAQGPVREVAREETSNQTPEESDAFGDWVAAAGDLDGDGTGDLMIGGVSTWIFSGTDGSLLREIEPGYAAGDVDLDGLVDTASVDRDGRITLRSLGEGAVLWSRLPEPWSPPTGPGPGIREVVAAGDVDADGHPDVAATVVAYDRTGRDLGSVALLSGRTGSSLLWIRSEDEAGFARAVAGIGDADGDGHADLAVARVTFGGATVLSSEAEHERVRENALHDAAVYSGATGELLHAVKVERTFAQASTVAAAGDQDADGRPDWLLGVSVLGPGSRGALVVLVSGISGTTLRTWEVEGGEIRSVAALADLDGDGMREFAAGTSGGGLNGMTGVYSGATGEALERFVGAIDYPYLGWSLAEVVDLDGDGTGELLIGATNPWTHPLAGYADVRSPVGGALLWRLRAP